MTFRVHKLDSFTKKCISFWVINVLFVLQKTTTMPSASSAYTNKNPWLLQMVNRNSASTLWVISEKSPANYLFVLFSTPFIYLLKHWPSKQTYSHTCAP